MNLKDKIKDIARYEYMNFMKDPNVVGVGCGNKYINNIDTGQACIRIYVKEKYEKGYNATAGIPKYYCGIPTDVIESGEFIASRGFDEKIRPAKMGYGISALSRGDLVGTAGSIVERTDSSGNKEIFLLSCNHIMADSNRLPIGTQIIPWVVR